MVDLSFCQRRQSSFQGNGSKRNGRHYTFGSVTSTVTGSMTSKMEFQSFCKTLSEALYLGLGSTKFLVLLIVKYFLYGSLETAFVDE